MTIKTNVEASLDDNNPISEIEIENEDDNSDLTSSEIDEANLITSSNPEKTNISQDSSFDTAQNHENIKSKCR